MRGFLRGKSLPEYAEISPFQRQVLEEVNQRGNRTHARTHTFNKYMILHDPVTYRRKIGSRIKLTKLLTQGREELTNFSKTNMEKSIHHK